MVVESFGIWWYVRGWERGRVVSLEEEEDILWYERCGGDAGSSKKGVPKEERCHLGEVHLLQVPVLASILPIFEALPQDGKWVIIPAA